MNTVQSLFPFHRSPNRGPSAQGHPAKVGFELQTVEVHIALLPCAGSLQMVGLTPARLPLEGRVHLPAPGTTSAEAPPQSRALRGSSGRAVAEPQGASPGPQGRLGMCDPDRRPLHPSQAHPVHLSGCHPPLTYPALQMQAPQARPRAGASCPAPPPGSRPRRPRPPRPWRGQGRSGAAGRPGAGEPRAHGDQSGTTERGAQEEETKASLARPRRKPPCAPIACRPRPSQTSIPSGARHSQSLSPSRPGLCFPYPPALFSALPYRLPSWLSDACALPH